jgi:hypothetical protein
LGQKLDFLLVFLLSLLRSLAGDVQLTTELAIAILLLEAAAQINLAVTHVPAIRHRL